MNLRRYMYNGYGVNHVLFNFENIDNNWINAKRNDSRIKLWVNKQNNSNFNISSTYSKFGTYSCKANNRAGQWSILLPNKDFTIEFWLLRKNTSSSSTVIVDSGSWITLCELMQTGWGNFQIFTNDSTSYQNYIAICNNNDDISGTSGSYTIPAFHSSNNNYTTNINDIDNVYRCWDASSSWKHIAITFQQIGDVYNYNTYLNKLRVYVDGQLVLDGYTNMTLSRYDSYGGIYFSFGDFSYGNYGYIDELRVTNKIIYSGTRITVPTSAFTN